MKTVKWLGMVGCLVIGSGGAMANDHSSQLAGLVDQAKACANIATAIERLDCYDQLFTKAPVATTKPAKASGEAAAVSAAAAASAKPAQADVEAAFPVKASNDSAGDKEEPVLHASVTSAKTDAYGKYYIYLDNGHVWREKERSRFRFKEGMDIRIEKGALGANNLYVEGKAGMTRVERVK